MEITFTGVAAFISCHLLQFVIVNTKKKRLIENSNNIINYTIYGTVVVVSCYSSVAGVIDDELKKQEY